MMLTARVVRGLLLWLILLSMLCSASEQLPARTPVPSSDLVSEHEETHYRFENDGTGQKVQSNQTRIMTEAGRRGFRELYFQYSSRTSDLRIDFFRIRKVDGSVIDADVSKAFDLTSPTSFKGIRLPNVEVGDLLEYQTTTTIRTPVKPSDFWVIHYANHYVTVKSEVVTLDVPAARKLSFKALKSAKYQVEEKGNRRIYRWEVSNPQPRRPEDALQAPLFSASTMTDWKQVGE
jgi:hypothetical protein